MLHNPEQLSTSKLSSLFLGLGRLDQAATHYASLVKTTLDLKENGHPIDKLTKTVWMLAEMFYRYDFAVCEIARHLIVLLTDTQKELIQSFFAPDQDKSLEDILEASIDRMEHLQGVIEHLRNELRRLALKNLDNGHGIEEQDLTDALARWQQEK
jgi:hypothetical protein